MAKSASPGTWSVTLLIGALDALVAAVGLLALLVVATTLSWLFDSGGTGTWLESFQTAIVIWLGAHGVPLGISASTQFGIAIPSYLIWSMPLGSMLLIFAFGWRGGKRLFPSISVWPAWLSAAIVYAGISSSVSTLVAEKSVHPNPIASYVLPASVYVAGLVSGSLFGKLPATAAVQEISMERIAGRNFIDSLSSRVHWTLASVATPALRAATGFVFALLAVSSVLMAFLIGFNWLSVIQLFEQLQGGVFGGFGSTALQIVYLPNMIVFVASWLGGYGFAIGAGSSVSPLGTALGPIPTIPVFGAIPVGHASIGMGVLIVPLLLALLATIVIRPYADSARHHFGSAIAAALSLGLAIAFIAAVEMALLSFLSHLSIGPGRMQDVGPSALWAFVWTFLEVGPIAVLASFYTAKPNQPSPIPEHLKR